MKNKVSIKIQGGIGNNLFQIACACAYSFRHDRELILSNDKFGITHNSLDTYKSNFLIEFDFVEKYNVSKFKNYNEPFFHYQEIPKIEGDVYLNGYYQSEKYFLDFENEIRELFWPPAEIGNVIREKYKELLNKNICSVHIRRGDYLKFPDHHPVQSINYYMKAIRTMSEDSIFLIFSDDINWCKQNFPNIEEKFVFIEGNKDYEDLLLMSLCKNNIIANSSFSWWGAWLNDNIDKKVVAPSKWFGSTNSNNNTVDLYCKNWNII